MNPLPPARVIRTGIAFLLLTFLAGAVRAEAPAAELPLLAKPAESRPVAKGEKPVVLAVKGEAKAVIVVPDEGPAWRLALMNRAAEEFRLAVEQRTGARLNLLPASQYAGGPAVFIGDSPAARKAGFEPGPLAAEGFRVVAKNGSLAILGDDNDPSTSERIADYWMKPVDTTGTLFGVYDALERFAGIRWYFPGELGTIVPKSPDFEIPPVDYSDAPMIPRRDMWPFHLYPDSPADQEAFRKKWRSGNGSGVIWNHSYVGWDETFGKTNPEYFALLKDGTRSITYYHGHLCHSLPAVLEQEVKNLEDFYGKGVTAPWGGWGISPRGDYTVLMPNDCFPGCECEACLEKVRLRNPQVPELEAHSELIHEYGARVAAEVNKRWPGKKVIVGAYDSYTLPPRTVKYPDNVVIGLCVMDGLAFHRDPKIRAFWLDIIDQYSRLTGNPVEVWNYTCWPQTSTKAPIHFPFTAVEWHRASRGRIAGEFINGGTGRTYALDHLTLYFWHRAMWNPDFDVQKALDEYYTLSFGPAAPAMKEYYDRMIRQWETVQWDAPAGRVGGLPLEELYGKTYPADFRARQKELEAEARALAPEGSDYRRRVDLVLAAHADFYTEAHAFETLGDGNELTVFRGAPTALDGRLDDPCWSAAPKAFLVDNVNGRRTAIASAVQVCWDDEAMYFAGRFDETAMDRLSSGPSEYGVWMNDCVELFLSPGIPDQYMQIVLDAGENVFDGWKTPTTVYTDVKDFKIGKAVAKAGEHWSFEIRIPFSEMGVAAPEPGTSWRSNLIRVRRVGRPTHEAEYSYFSQTLGQSHHNPRFFGTLRLSGETRP